MPAQAYEPGDITPTEPPPDSAFFEYIGGTAMTVLGPETGRRYRFGWPGALVAVDLKDASSLGSVPHLRKVVIEKPETGSDGPGQSRRPDVE
jgi:hypothetical protein